MVGCPNTPSIQVRARHSSSNMHLYVWLFDGEKLLRLLLYSCGTQNIKDNIRPTCGLTCELILENRRKLKELFRREKGSILGLFQLFIYVNSGRGTNTADVSIDHLIDRQGSFVSIFIFRETPHTTTRRHHRIPHTLYISGKPRFAQPLLVAITTGVRLLCRIPTKSAPATKRGVPQIKDSNT